MQIPAEALCSRKARRDLLIPSQLAVRLPLARKERHRRACRLLQKAQTKRCGLTHQEFQKAPQQSEAQPDAKWNSYITKGCVFSTKFARALCEAHRSGPTIEFNGPALFVP